MKRLYVVGIGPGASDKMTVEARNALEQCDVIAGYQVYVQFVKAWLPDKEYIVTGMTKEVDRCELALDSAASGKQTAIVCSGDAGVYGMASVVLELAEKYPSVEVVVVPGVTAALSGGAVLGAPIGHDFAVISLSDLLTSWETIEQRIRCAAMADFAICIYNPSSKNRADYLRRACEIIREYKDKNVVCGYVKQIGRDGQCCRICTLETLAGEPVDMFTTVFIGNCETKKIGNYMVTPRGYHFE
ncbi:MAG: precorrin-3B C(17)-methyltransferase [Eubacteriales bacterium]|nr:precorrin-3B C(17)-methyltransferase [Eubacteriales bacterium]